MTDTDKCNSCPLHHRTCPACGGGLSGHAAGDSGGPGVKKSVLVSQCLACGWEARTEVTWPPTERIEQAATEPDWGDVGRVPREEYDVLRRLTPRMEGWFPRRPK